jgi:hypothetical protein
MNVKVRISRVRTEVESDVAEFVQSDEHHIAVSHDIGKSIELRPEAQVTVASGQTLQAVSTTSLKMTAEQRLGLEKALADFATANLPILKKAYPQLGGTIGGVELFLASKNALDAWTDPERTSLVKPLIKTARVLFDCLDVAQTHVPALKEVPYLENVGIFLKVGDSVWQLWTDISKAKAGSSTR